MPRVIVLLCGFLCCLVGAKVCPGQSWWQPHPRWQWQWQLSGTVNTTVNAKMFDIDLFETPQATIDLLHGQGRVVVCYFSGGSFEPGRPDSGNFTAAVKGNQLVGWPGEFWLDTRATLVRQIMEKRLDLARAKDCDGVEPDNMDAYANNPGFSGGLTAATQLNYNRWMADQAHSRGLSVGLKNDLDQIVALVDWFDWHLNEECSSFSECDMMLPFTVANKAVFGAVYQEDGQKSTLCADPNTNNFDFLYKNLNLDSWGSPCRVLSSPPPYNQYSCRNTSAASSADHTADSSSRFVPGGGGSSSSRSNRRRSSHSSGADGGDSSSNKPPTQKSSAPQVGSHPSQTLTSPASGKVSVALLSMALVMAVLH